jgi:hypothetical protein
VLTSTKGHTLAPTLSTVMTSCPLSPLGWLMIIGFLLSSMRMESTSSTIANPS